MQPRLNLPKALDCPWHPSEGCHILHLKFHRGFSKYSVLTCYFQVMQRDEGLDLINS